ncbi:hypothetical protein MTP99_013032 [Tenebrio molitor]|jgi:hypothetical protein|nr:hypothetical protein MTP99_013032 [Tenebrio molitor]
MNKSQLSAQVSEKRENIKKRVAYFTYFNEWDDETVSQLCQISKIKTFKPDQIILNGQFGQKSYVYFVTDGSCRVIECLTLPHTIGGDAKSVFINVRNCPVSERSYL